MKRNIHGIYTSIQSWGTQCHITKQVWIQRMSSTHSILVRVQHNLFEVTEGLNYKDKEICNTTHKPEYCTMWQKK
jgi:hypothetical protein